MKAVKRHPTGKAKGPGLAPAHGTQRLKGASTAKATPKPGRY